MSVLVAGRSVDGAWPDAARWLPIAQVPLRRDYVHAIASWGLAEQQGWAAILDWDGATWSDLVNRAADGCDPDGELLVALGALAGACSDIAIWYAGFSEDIPAVDSPAELVALLRQEVGAGELEPAVRMRRDQRLA